MSYCAYECQARHFRAVGLEVLGYQSTISPAFSQEKGIDSGNHMSGFVHL